MNKKISNLPSECTTIIVGSQMSADGSRIVARSEDWDAMFAKNLTIYRPGEPGSVDPMRFDEMCIRDRGSPAGVGRQRG